MPILRTHYPTFAALFDQIGRIIVRAYPARVISATGRQARRLLRPLQGAIILISPLLLLAPGYWFAPATDTLPGPRFAVLRTKVPGLQLGVQVQWYDLGLNKQGGKQQLPFGSSETLRLPDYLIHTTAGRLAMKRALTPRGRWTECENCYGPMARASLYRINDYNPPAKMQLTQNRELVGDRLFFDVALIADETQFDERPLRVRDLAALMAEMRDLLASDVKVNFPADGFGPELRYLDPIRAERNRDSVVVWMGGKVGYSLTPDSHGGSFVNGAWLSGTDHAGIQKIERF